MENLEFTCPNACSGRPPTPDLLLPSGLQATAAGGGAADGPASLRIVPACLGLPAARLDTAWGRPDAEVTARKGVNLLCGPVVFHRGCMLHLSSFSDWICAPFPPLPSHRTAPNMSHTRACRTSCPKVWTFPTSPHLELGCGPGRAGRLVLEGRRHTGTSAGRPGAGRCRLRRSTPGRRWGGPRSRAWRA